jgi:hypothetical protein
MRKVTAAPATAFPGNGQQRVDLAEIAALKKEVAKLKAERDILEKDEPCAPLVRAQWRAPFSRGKRHDVRVRCEASAYLASELDVRRSGRVPVVLDLFSRRVVGWSMKADRAPHWSWVRS